MYGRQYLIRAARFPMRAAAAWDVERGATSAGTASAGGGLLAGCLRQHPRFPLAVPFARCPAGGRRWPDVVRRVARRRRGRAGVWHGSGRVGPIKAALQ